MNDRFANLDFTVPDVTKTRRPAPVRVTEKRSYEQIAADQAMIDRLTSWPSPYLPATTTVTWTSDSSIPPGTIYVLPPSITTTTQRFTTGLP